ncbi:MAG: phage baseplate assembly protein V [Selenomonadaceae bacterium]|nr:phage baseplate assembly protein V [Selenomonadaceae bacterium]
MGRLRVQFDIEDKDNKKIFLPYRTPYSGIIFMPEIGDAVEIFYTGGEGFIDTIIRTKELDEEFKNVTDKYIGNNRKQRIFFREKSLEIKSTDNSIFLDDKKIVMTAGKNKITLDENGITINNVDKNQIVLNNQGITVNNDGKNQVVLNNQGVTVNNNDKNQILLNNQGVTAKSDGKIIGDSSGDTSFKVGGSFKAKASGSAKIDGQSVELG